MRQRVPPRWGSRDRARHVPQLLVEVRDDALALSDFTRFHQAGFEVAWCSGPAGRPEDCALLRNEDCRLVRGADVVLHALDPEGGVATAIRARHPGTAIVQIVPTSVKEGGDDVGPYDHRSRPDFVLSGSDCVETQVRALRLALCRRHAVDANPAVGAPSDEPEPGSGH